MKIHRFKGKDIYKKDYMEIGTFGVKKFKIINIKKEDLLKWKQLKTSTRNHRSYTCQWESPVAYPDDGKMYDWDEATTNWVEIE